VARCQRTEHAAKGAENVTATGSWLKLYRSMARHPLWLCSPFTIGQAWLDLMMAAAYQEAPSPRGDLTVKRGQVLTSIESLGRRWGRDRKTVRAWLLDFERAGMLARVSAHGRDGGYTLLTLLNYEEFQARTRARLDDGRDDALDDGRDDDTDDALDDALDYGLPTSKEVEESKESKERVETRARARMDLVSGNGKKSHVPHARLVDLDAEDDRT
jgi:hypothetical protein